MQARLGKLLRGADRATDLADRAGSLDEHAEKHFHIRPVARIIGWVVGGYVAVAGTVSGWVAAVTPWIEPYGPYGWLIATVAGTAAITATLWLLGVAGLSLRDRWRSPRAPGPAAPGDAQAAVPPAAPAESGAGVPTLTQGPAREWRPQGLYVAGISVDTDQLPSDLVIQIFVSVFNATDRNIRIKYFRGRISFAEKSGVSAEERVILPSPKISYERMNEQPISNLNQALISIEQRMPSEVARSFLRSFEAGNRIHLSFESLEMRAVADRSPGDAVRLPLWDGVIVYKAAGRPMTGKAAVSRGSVSIKVSVG